MQHSLVIVYTVIHHKALQDHVHVVMLLSLLMTVLVNAASGVCT